MHYKKNGVDVAYALSPQFVFVIVWFLASACADLNSGPGADAGGSDEQELPWGEGEVSVCDNVRFVGSSVYLESGSVDSGYPTVSPVEGACPPGTVPSSMFLCDDVAICACENICPTECGEREVCQPGGMENRCACHVAYEGEPGNCVWKSGLDNPNFDDCSGWTFKRTFQRNIARGTPAPVVEVIGGRLHLGVSRRCDGVSASTTMRVPPSDEFPQGVAFVFDYMASEVDDDNGQPASISWRGPTGGENLQGRPEPTELRRCLTLGDYAAITRIIFTVAPVGLCADKLDYQLWVDNIRIEADSDCL